MIRIVLNGALGRMGQEVAKMAEASDQFEVAASVDVMAKGDGYYPSLDDFTGDADVIVDFSNHAGTQALLDYAVKRGLPAVIATTGQTEQELAMIDRASSVIPIFHSANMSLGVALLVDLAAKAAAVMPNADIEIVETHHNRKLDAPSGTALMIAKAIQTVRNSLFFKFGRGESGKRDSNEIGIHAVRRGNIVGIHEVLISTDNQTITLKHEAHSRALFAEGALTAAEFIQGKAPGLYDMNSIVRREEN